jgi:F-type H+-transporting ATPase subunit epsilon
MPLTVDIVTPDGHLLTREVESIVLPTPQGETGILCGHIPLLTKILRGELKLLHGGSTDLIVVDHGFAQVIGDHVAILTEGAVDIVDIDLKSVEAAQKRAEEALEEAKRNNLDPMEIEQMETRMQFLLTQKLLKSGHR